MKIMEIMEIKKRTIAQTAAGILLISCMAGCSRQNTAKIAPPDIVSSPEPVAAESIKEIPIDFPFWDSQHYTLTLARIDESSSEYELRLYENEKNLLQQIPCGALAEPIQFSYDSLFYGVYHDLEIFPADRSTGLLYVWKDERFSENAVEIPKYTETRGTAMLTVDDSETEQIKKICQFNHYQNCVEELRRWQLQKDTGLLTIWDHPEKQNLYEGTVRLDENGELINQEYYDLLLWKDLYLPGDLHDTTDKTSMMIWIDTSGTDNAEASWGTRSYESIQQELFGNDWHTGECESREALLAALGLENSTPVYQYYDRYHNLQMELYKNGTTEQFCGIAHEYLFDNQWKKTQVMYGFIINEVPEAEWTEQNAFSTKAVDGTDGSGFVDEYEEIMEYTPEGDLDYFRSQGLMEREEDGKLQELLSTIVEINFIYRDDGTLYCRDYSHNERIFGTTCLSLDSYYDEQGRIAYENGYITHGTLETYYIYEDAGTKPAYCLNLDYASEYAIPSMVRYQ